MVLLLLIVLGTANVKAQVRIGGNIPPNPAAALDLNAAEGTTAGTKGLALPRVTLGSSTATLDGTTANITGMLVYNIGGSLSSGVYYWGGSNWVLTSSGGNAVMDATPGRGLVRSGSGSSTDAFTLGIAAGGVDSTMLTPLVTSLSPLTLMYVNGAWRPVAYARVYNRGYLPSTLNAWYDTITSTCLTQPVATLLSSGGAVPRWMWVSGPQNVLYVKPLATGQPVYVYAHCWHLLY